MTEFALGDFAIIWAVAALGMTAAWAWQYATRNAGLVDAMWAGLLAITALYYGATASGHFWPRLLVALLGAIWGFRLALHVLWRVLHEREDGRYAYLRGHWNDHQGKFFLFFQAQAILVVVFSIPFWVAAQNPTNELSWTMVAGVVVWVCSLAGEAYADMQLQQFRSQPRNRGKTCKVGLWRYSRHPNYFFEWLHWFAYVLIAIGSEMWWLALAGTVVMFISLNWLTGIPFAEAQSLRSRGDDYRQYQAETNAFFPWWPRRHDQ